MLQIKNIFFVYILKSEKDSKRYIGSTNNLQRRMSQHNSGMVKSTIFRRPLKMIYMEKFPSREEAEEREKGEVIRKLGIVFIRGDTITVISPA